MKHVILHETSQFRNMIIKDPVPQMEKKSVRQAKLVFDATSLDLSAVNIRAR